MLPDLQSASCPHLPLYSAPLAPGCRPTQQAFDCPAGVLADHACEAHAACGNEVLLLTGDGPVSCPPSRWKGAGRQGVG